MIENLGSHEAILAAIINTSEDAIISKNLDSIIMSWNKAAERLFGYTEEEAVGEHVFLIIPENLRSEEEMIINNLKAGKRIEHFRTIRITKHGNLIPISLTISPIKDEMGKIMGASKIARDITQQVKDEETIRKYARSLETINEVGKKISAKLDYQAILQLVTDAVTEVSGAQFGAFFSNKTDSKGETYMLYTLSGAPREAFEKFGIPRNTDIFKKTFSGQGVFRSDNITMDQDYGKNPPHHGMPTGHLPVVSYLAVPVISQKGVVIGGLFLGHGNEGVFKEEHEKIVSAIAAQAAIALENSQLYEDIKLLNNKKDEFISMANHELKTPLTTMGGYLQLVDENPLFAKEFIPRVIKQVKRLEKMITDLLDISTIRSGHMDYRYEKTTLQKLIKDSIESIDKKDHSIHVDMPAEEIILSVDSSKIIQVILNLLSNAIKYSEKNTFVTVTAFSLGDQVQISVADEGMGIPKEHVNNIFNQFYRIADVGQQVEGMGLGLFICKEIVDHHRGRIWVESEVGKGSIFSISLPVDIR